MNGWLCRKPSWLLWKLTQGPHGSSITLPGWSLDGCNGKLSISTAKRWASTAVKGRNKPGAVGESSQEIQLLLQQYGIDVAAVANKSPITLRGNPAEVQERLEYLDSIGVDVKKVVSRHPIILRHRIEKLMAMVEFFQASHLDAAKVFQHAPSALKRTVPSLQSKFAVLEALGLNASKMLRAAPPLFSLSEDNVRRTMAFLEGNGLDAKKVVENCPSVLCRRTATLASTLNTLRSLGTEPSTVVNRTPRMLAYNSLTLREGYDFFQLHGFDVAKILMTHPVLLALDVNRNLKPKVRFLCDEIGLPIAQVHKSPDCLKYSLERIQLRHQYLLALGLVVDNFPSKIHLSDEDFARNVAKQTLDHYRQWMSNASML